MISRLQRAAWLFYCHVSCYISSGRVADQSLEMIDRVIVNIYSCLYSRVCPWACMQALIATARYDLALGWTCTSSWTAAEAAALVVWHAQGRFKLPLQHSRLSLIMINTLKCCAKWTSTCPHTVFLVTTTELHSLRSPGVYLLPWQWELLWR